MQKEAQRRRWPLRPAEALVLFDLLQREIGDRKEKRLTAIIDHPAEYWALNTVNLRLEREIFESFSPDYAAAVAKAREQVMFECDPEGTYPLGAHE